MELFGMQPCKGGTNPVAKICVPPLQGLAFIPSPTRGFTPGYYIAGPSALKSGIRVESAPYARLERHEPHTSDTKVRLDREAAPRFRRHPQTEKPICQLYMPTTASEFAGE